MAATKRRKLTDAELSWFDLSKYSIRKLRPLSQQGWFQIVSDRAWLRQMLEAGMTAEALAFFEPLKVDPLRQQGWLGASKSSSAAQSDMPTVALMRVSEISGMAALADLHQLSHAAPFDTVLPLEVSGGLDAVAHISIRLRGTRAQIEDDFGSWLKAYYEEHGKARNRYDATRRHLWMTGQYLPYFDLRFFAEINDARIAPKQFAKLLGANPVVPSNYMKTPSQGWDTFSYATAQTMRLQLGQEG